MQHTDRDLFVKWWQDAWTQGLWAASWPKCLEGLTPEQAAWQPRAQDGAPHHSIWQNVEHMIFWRETVLARIDGAPQPPQSEVATRNFPQPAQPTDQAWADTRHRFEETHQQVLAAVRNRGEAAASLMGFLPHDAYHMGQISYIRALLGLPPLA